MIQCLMSCSKAGGECCHGHGEIQDSLELRAHLRGMCDSQQ